VPASGKSASFDWRVTAIRATSDMTDFVLYNAPQSTCSQRVRFVLNAKGAAFEEHKLDLFAGDQLKPDYLKINPNGVVPTLVHRGRPITDSAVIIEYLDEVLSGPERFVPDDAVERAQMRSLMRFIDEVPTPAIRVPSYNIAFLRHFRSMTEEEFVALAESKPLRKEFLLKMGRTGFPKEEMDASLDRLRRGIARMDATIAASGGPWLMGRNLTLADIAIMPVVVRMNDIKLDDMWKDRPAISLWLEAIAAHPAFGKTYYFGSLLTEKYPALKQELAG
jgi:glutathione S-transferase